MSNSIGINNLRVYLPTVCSNTFEDEPQSSQRVHGVTQSIFKILLQ